MNEEIRKLFRDLLVELQHKSHVCLGTAALKLDCSPKYLREHLDLFPNAWKFPGKKGEIRIPIKDIEAHTERFRLFHRDATGKRKKRVLPLPPLIKQEHQDVPPNA
jgi:hypothetical protein